MFTLHISSQLSSCVRRGLALSWVLVAMALATQAQTQAACTFNFFSPTTPFKLPDGTPIFMQPIGINDFGTIVGYSSPGKARGLIRWANGGFTRVKGTIFLNARNDQLRAEVATLDSELATLGSNQQRGDASIDELRADLRRVRLYAGMDPATGPGLSIVVRGPIDGPGVEDLVNELRNAGAEAIAIDGVRLVPGVVAIGGRGAVTLANEALDDPFEVVAIGAPDKLTGSLTRSGGLIAQLAATQPEVVVEVTPTDDLLVPGTNRDLIPTDGRPRL